MNAITTLFQHAWLRFVRSKGLGHKLLETLLMAFIGLNIAVSLSVAGLVGPELIKTAYPGADVLVLGLGFLLYYFVMDLLIRYFLQKFPVMGIRPYLVLPLPRKTIVNSMLLRSLFSFWNLMSWFLAVPFYFSVLRGYGDGISAAAFFAMVALLTVLSNYLAFWLVAVRTQKLVAFAVLILAVGLLYFEFSGRISLVAHIGGLAMWLLTSPLGWLLLLAMPVLMYIFLLSHFSSALGEESLGNFDRGFKFDAGLRLFGKWGPIGEMMDLETRLILRNKRARQYFFTSLIFLLLPLGMFGELEEMATGMKLLVGFLLTGIVTLNHGQLILSWNSLHFDFLLTRGGSIKQLMLAKYYVLVACSLLAFVLTLPYAFLIPGILPISMAMLLINVTVSAQVYMLLAAVSSLHVDPNEGGAFSFNGFGVAHYVITIPILAAPFAMYGLGLLFGNHITGLLFVAGFGTLLLVLHKPIIGLIASVFSNNRYRISATLRNK